MAVQCQRSTAMNCSYCSGLFSAPSEALLLTHIRVTHSSDPGFSIQCSVSGCSRTFTNFRTFQNHRLTHRGKESESGDGATLDENADTEGDFNSSIAVAHGPTSDDMQFRREMDIEDQRIAQSYPQCHARGHRRCPKLVEII